MILHSIKKSTFPLLEKVEQKWSKLFHF
jgi:hypothetical protein